MLYFLIKDDVAGKLESVVIIDLLQHTPPLKIPLIEPRQITRRDTPA